MNPTATIHGWYVPDKCYPRENRCVVCDRQSTFHLCARHAIPGMVVEVENDSKAYKYVVSNWLVERAGRLRLITMNDLAMGQLFGGYEGFERQLQEQGYQVRALIETFEELVALKHQNPGLAVILWSPNLPKGEDQDSTR
jgi:hypothetical protein